jgi:hypothetical protein
MLFLKKISTREIISGMLSGFLLYVIIAFLNISNEDIYNWEIKLIFSNGGVLSISALILLWLWYITFSLWLLSVIIRLIRQLLSKMD